MHLDLGLSWFSLFTFVVGLVVAGIPWRQAVQGQRKSDQKIAELQASLDTANRQLTNLSKSTLEMTVEREPVASPLPGIDGIVIQGNPMGRAVRTKIGVRHAGGRDIELPGNTCIVDTCLDLEVHFAEVVCTYTPAGERPRSLKAILRGDDVEFEQEYPLDDGTVETVIQHETTRAWIGLDEALMLKAGDTLLFQVLTHSPFEVREPIEIQDLRWDRTDIPSEVDPF